MPEFGSPFSGLANDRKLADEELIRAVRFMIAAEYEATQEKFYAKGAKEVEAMIRESK